MTKQWKRRSFLSTAGRVAAGLVILPNSRSVWGYPANERLNIAVVGVGGMGAWNLAHFAGENVEYSTGMRVKPSSQPKMTGENIVAICDTDERSAGESAPRRRNPPGHALARYGQAKKFNDYRQMLDEMDREIDAVVVSTPDHTHAPASLAAMLRGKHVYSEKPGAISVYEARMLAKVAAEKKVATQLGTQIHASDNFRRIVELVRSGAIGAVEECHIFVGGRRRTRERPTETPPVPKGLHWDLFVGTAPYRPYHPTYSRGCGGNWQGWWDFGIGGLGNTATHYFNLAFWALDLRYPISVEAEGPPPHPERSPEQIHVRYRFPARGEMPPVTLTWTRGDQLPPVVAENDFPDWAWGVFVGTEGMLLVNYPQRMLWPADKFAKFQPPKPSIPPSIGKEIGRRPEWMAAYKHHEEWRRTAEVGHRAEWIAACKTGSPTSSHFGYSGPLTETVNLGVVAHRSGAKLEWDAENLRVANSPEATALLRREYRSGWTL
ncbi:MAG: Gfo/Idh/MocA family oxidoreductase [Acidobacteriota bacterium]|nr:Gfo/Idh/MocA family oxidoreductase [Acidobacteriota bacterium]